MFLEAPIPCIPEFLSMSLEAKTTGADELTLILGYLNFSSGAFDPEFCQPRPRGRTAGNDSLARRISVAKLHLALQSSLQALAGQNGTFRDCRQGERVIHLLFDVLLPTYRQFHRDLLSHQPEAWLFNSFFVGRAAQTVLGHLDPESTDEAIVDKSIRQLNNYIGYRPVATLQSQDIEPYDHEWVSPIPIYLRGVGAAHGPYRALLLKTIEFLEGTETELLRMSHFSPERLLELSIDPRAYDFDHPVNKRPNHHFGQWDPHQIDSDHYFCRFIVHQVTLDALLNRLQSESQIDREELMLEASAVLAGTILMASGISGSGPDAHDSNTTLESLLPRSPVIAMRFTND
jgi:hypothetical protein